MEFKHLFAPGKIGALTLKNRIVLTPMSTLFSEADGSVGETAINWYVRRAKGGAGLVVVEAAQVATSIARASNVGQRSKCRRCVFCRG